MTDLQANPQEARGAQNGQPVITGAGPRPADGAPSLVDVVAIGDITVTADSVLVPQGRFPLAGTTWTVQDATTMVRTTPPYARRLATVFGVTVVGLGFLLIKERHRAGFVRVTVVGEGLVHSVQFPPGPESTARVAGLVNRARALAAAASLRAGEQG